MAVEFTQIIVPLCGLYILTLGTLYEYVLTEIKTWISDHTHSLYGMLLHPSPNYSDGLTEAPLNLRNECVITSHYFTWM